MRIATVLACRHKNPKVAIYLDKSSKAYASFFGVLAAGGFYAPLNISAPPARNARILAEFKPDITLTTRNLEPSVGDTAAAGEVVTIDELPAADMISPKAARLAYVIFTSGSTGTPKGVMISRTALAHYINWIESAFDVREGDRWAQHPNIGFDLSVLDIYGALTQGAAIYPLTTDRQSLMPARFIRDNKITIWNSVPSVVDLMARARQLTSGNLQSVRLANFCGEPLLARHVGALYSANPEMVVQNTYGPTEATVSCSEVILSPKMNYRGSIEIGRPISNMNFYVKNSGYIYMPEKEDCEGELLISGPQLSDGYWNDQSRTSTAFSSEVVDGREVRVYHTGDLVEVADGHILFKGRVDDQIKIRGYRFELGDIDDAASSLGLGVSCTVIVGDTLHCFFEGNPTLNSRAIVDRLSKLLPDYAVPTQYHAISSIPRNANDKLDRKALQSFVEYGQSGNLSK